MSHRTNYDSYMVILSDGTIKRHVANGTIGVEPEPEPVQYQPASLDIRLGKNYSNEHTGEMHTDCDKIIIEPQTFYLAHTLEVVSLPDHISAMVSGRSSLGRKGLIVHATAGWIDAGFSGDITLEVYNFSNEPIVLVPEQRIGQILFFPMDEPAEEPYGSKDDSKYQDQRGPTESRLEDDPDSDLDEN